MSATTETPVAPGISLHSTARKRKNKGASGVHFPGTREGLGITKPALVRLTRRAGAPYAYHLVIELSRALLVNYLRDVIDKCHVYASSVHRKHIKTSDVVHALRTKGHPIYGFGGY